MGKISVQGVVKFIVAMIFVLVGAVALRIGMLDLFNGLFGASLFYIGIGSFILSLVIMSCLTYFSISAEKERRKSLILDRKEIRRSIVISFTILYMLLISFYFREVESVTHVISAVNSSVNETVLNVTANSSFTTITILNKTTNLTGNGLTGEGLTHLSSVITAFTTVYLVIIGFYFGSRVYEKIKEIKDAEEVLKIQYVMDEINKEEFKEKMEVLKGTSQNSQFFSKALVSLGFTYWQTYKDTMQKEHLDIAINLTEIAYKDVIRLDENEPENEKLKCQVINNLGYYLAERGDAADREFAIKCAEFIKGKIDKYPDERKEWQDTYDHIIKKYRK